MSNQEVSSTSIVEVTFSVDITLQLSVWPRHTTPHCIILGIEPYIYREAERVRKEVVRASETKVREQVPLYVSALTGLDPDQITISDLHSGAIWVTPVEGVEFPLLEIEEGGSSQEEFDPELQIELIKDACALD